MSSPRERLLSAIEAWLADDARERIARARGAADADPPLVVAERHAQLRSPRARELFEEARERGLLDADETRTVAAWLRAAHAAIGRARADERVREVLSARVPHDSDHHDPVSLLLRMVGEAHEGRRRAIARSIAVALAPKLLAALREGLADVEESLEGAAWLRDVEPPADLASAEPDDARAVLSATQDAWIELVERAAHASGPIETWPDLLFALRASRFDALFDPRPRFRRAAAELAGLGVERALEKRARVEAAAAATPPRLRSSIVPLAVPLDVRIVPPSLELGLASERDARVAIGRALAVAWTHPALPPLVARADDPTVAGLLGLLFAHLMAEPRAGSRGLSSAEARVVRERAVLLELFELRTDAAVVLARQHASSSSYAEAAEHAVRDAWRVEVEASVAAGLCLADRRAPRRLRAARLVCALFAWLREHYDEDFWRNPRAAEPLRAACERGAALTVEAWAEELGLTDPGAQIGARLAELVR